MRPHLMLVSAAVLLAGILAISGGALAQDTPYIPSPGTNDLGISENDVRDEPNHPDDENGFPDEHDGEFWSPKDDNLILDAYSEVVAGHGLGVRADEDVSNIQNVLMHGNNHETYEQHVYPGRVSFEAWWGHWSDTGGGGDLQQNPTTANAVNTDPNGAIDDADDCDEAAEWDEFVWRGQNSCAEDAGIPEANITDNMDQMFAFIQPGTHDQYINNLVLGCGCPDDAFLWNDSDEWHQADFAYENPGGQVWRQANGFARYVYDASLMISTQVVTSVNPLEIETPESGASYDPFTGATGATHAHDIDIYSSIHPAVEDAYRATVWDPPQDYGEDSDTPLADQDNVFSDLHENGLKGFAKHPVHDAKQDAETQVFDTVDAITQSTEPQQGLADDVVFGPYFHEPNTADDQYLVGNEIASHDPATSYGGLDGNYYQPGAGQTYDTYANEEHFWMDARVGVNTCPVWVPTAYCYNGFGHVTPEIPSPSDPIASTANEDDDNTFGPTILYWTGNAGTWFDENGDTWVGDPTGESDAPDDSPYNNGTIDDPNDYDSDEFRGTHGVNWDAKLVPTEDNNGDGEKDWGTTGVYVMGTFTDGNPYSNAAMDVVGDTADPILTPLREDENVGGTVDTLAPSDENGQLSRHRTHGEIDLSPIAKPGEDQAAGLVHSGKVVVFPAGNLDAPFKVVSEAELTDDSRQSQAPGNEDAFLEGEAIVDVDHYNAILDTQ